MNQQARSMRCQNWSSDSYICNLYTLQDAPLQIPGRGGRGKINVGDTTRAPLQIIHKWTAHWLYPCRCQMSDKRNTDGMTISRSYSRRAVNSLCETMITPHLAVPWFLTSSNSLLDPASRDVKNVFQFPLVSLAHNQYCCSFIHVIGVIILPLIRQVVRWGPFISYSTSSRDVVAIDSCLSTVGTPVSRQSWPHCSLLSVAFYRIKIGLFSR